jgi:HlyD family secretion protein
MQFGFFHTVGIKLEFFGLFWCGLSTEMWYCCEFITGFASSAISAASLHFICISPHKILYFVASLKTIAMKFSFFILILGLLLWSCGKEKPQLAQPEIAKLTEAVYASGTLVPESEYRVMSVSDGIITSVRIKAGDVVKTGSLLFSLSNSNLMANVNAAQQLLNKTLPLTSDAAPQLRELRNRLQNAQAKLRFDSLQFKRFSSLWESEAISKREFEQAQLQYESSQREVQALQQQIRQVNLNAALQTQQAENQVRIANTSQQNTQLKSFGEGMVYEVLKYPGDMVYPNQPLAIIGSKTLIAKLMIDETDLGKIQMGQKVLLTMDAFADQIFHAEITRIYPMLNRVEQSIRVDATLLDALPQQLYGLNVEANIVIREAENALVIPKALLLPGDSVWVMKGKEKHKVKIQRGVEDAQRVQVKSGLTENSQLILK